MDGSTPRERLLQDAGDASWDVVSRPANRRTAAPRSMGDGQVVGSVGQVRNRHINSEMSNCPSAEHVICWLLDPTRDESANKRFAPCTIGKSTYARQGR